MKAKVYSFNPAISVDQPFIKGKKLSTQMIGTIVVILVAACIFIMHLSSLQTASYSNQNNSGEVTHAAASIAASANGSTGKLLGDYLENFQSRSTDMENRLTNYRIDSITILSKTNDEVLFNAVLAVKPTSNRSTWIEHIGSLDETGWTKARTVSVKAERSGNNFSITEIRNID